MLVHIYQTTQHRITEDGNLQQGTVFSEHNDYYCKDIKVHCCGIHLKHFKLLHAVA